MVRGVTRAVGAGAERLAQRYLKQRGLTPVAENFQCRLGEIDLVMLDDECLVVIEVRYRNQNSLVRAGLTIDRRKQQKIIRTTAMFVAWNERFANHAIRFDAVGIDAVASGQYEIDWIRDAFRPIDARL